MAYRFNSGRGGVTCDVCGILYDADLSFKEYEETYGKNGDDGDLCALCKNGIKREKKEEVDNIINDGWRN